MPDMRLGSDVKHVITLVHGTFARGAAWTQPGGKLPRHLHDQLPGRTEIRNFEWSGRNQHDARQEGAAALRQQLTRQLAEFPNAKHYIVAHSHGGNVALYALGDAALDAAISAVFCLNTPFISALKRNMNNYRKLIRLLFVLVAASASLLLAHSLAQMADDWMRATSKGREPTSLEVAHIGGYLVIMLILIAFTWLSIRLISRLSRGSEVRERLLAQFKLPDLRSARVVCINNAGDEVGILFSILAALSHVPYIMSHYAVLRVLAWIAVFLAAAYLVSSLSGFHPISPGPFFLSELLGHVPEGVMRNSALAVSIVAAILGFMLLAIIMYAYWVVLIAYLVNGLITQLPYGVGGRHARDMLLVRLEGTLVPVTSCLIEFHDLDRSIGLLSHSTAYDDDEALRLISRRMRELSSDPRNGQSEVSSVVL